MVPEPTLSEVLWRLDEVSRQMTILAADLKNDYVRKDVYEARHNSMANRVAKAESEIKDVETELAEKDKAADNFRRQIFVGIILAAIPAVLGLLLALNNFLAAGGATP